MQQKWTLVSQISHTRVTYTLTHWATRKRLNNHCNNKDLLNMKQRITATGFPHTSAILAQSTILESRELYMAVLAIEWRHLEQLGPDHLCDFRACFHIVYIQFF